MLSYLDGHSKHSCIFFHSPWLYITDWWVWSVNCKDPIILLILPVVLSGSSLKSPRGHRLCHPESFQPLRPASLHFHWLISKGHLQMGLRLSYRHWLLHTFMRLRTLHSCNIPIKVFSSFFCMVTFLSEAVSIADISITFHGVVWKTVNEHPTPPPPPPYLNCWTHVRYVQRFQGLELI